MPWLETGPMSERKEFIDLALRNELPFARLCALYGISRRVGYKWLDRFRNHGYAGLQDRPHIALTRPHTTPTEIANAVVQAKMAHPFWGPKKLLALLRSAQPDVAWPAVSTAHGILDRAGLVEPSRARRRWPNRDRAPVPQGPNDLWYADHKGHFAVQHKRCEPLTVTDAFSRKLMVASPVSSTSVQETQRLLARAFCEFGLPLAMQTDNGGPFGSTGLGRLSRLSVWLLRLNIEVFRSRPGRPTDNGQHERVHATMLREVLSELRTSGRPADEVLEKWRIRFNELRPHEGIGMATPESLWQPSSRQMPSRIEEFSYPGYMEHRRVRTDGSIKLDGKLLFVSEVLTGEVAGLEPLAEGGYLLHVGPLAVAQIRSDYRIIATRDRPERYGAGT